MARTNQKSTAMKQSKNSVAYDSNPFTLTFSALGRFFSSNVGWAIALIVLGVIGFVGNSINFIVDAASNNESTSTVGASSFSSTDSSVVIAVAIIIFVVVIIAVVFALVAQTFLSGMFSYVALKSEAGESASFSEAFNATAKRFWRLLLAQLLANLKIFGWTLLFIIPGIIAGYRYQLLPYLIMNESEDEKGIGDSHEKTKALVKGRLWELFGISFVATIIPIVGSILGLSGKAAAYNQLLATSGKSEDRPKIHWLNYLGLLILLGFILLISMVIVITVAIIANK